MTDANTYRNRFLLILFLLTGWLTISSAASKESTSAHIRQPDKALCYQLDKDIQAIPVLLNPDDFSGGSDIPVLHKSDQLATEPVLENHTRVRLLLAEKIFKKISYYILIRNIHPVLFPEIPA